MKEFETILLDLKRKIFKPVYFFSGEEPYYIDELSDCIESGALEEGEREFNQTIIYGKDVDLASILSLAKQFPMMGEKQVLIVKEAQNIKEFNKSGDEEVSAKDKKKAGNPSIENFLNYLVSPQPSTILVFCYKYKTLDKRSSLSKAIQKHSVYFESKRLYDNQLPEWIKNYVKDKKYSINERAAAMMAEYLGNDLSKIANEINKLFVNLAQGKEISQEHIQENIGISKEFNVFELQSALARRDVLQANRIINYFAANDKENPSVLVLANLYGYFSKILKYHSLPDKSKFTVAQALGVNPYFVADYANAARSFDNNKLKHIFSYLKECDLKSKGVDNPSTPYGELLKELVFKILH